MAGVYAWYDVAEQFRDGDARLLFPKFPRGYTRCLYYAYNVYFYDKGNYYIVDVDDERYPLQVYRGST